MDSYRRPDSVQAFLGRFTDPANALAGAGPFLQRLMPFERGEGAGLPIDLPGSALGEAPEAALTQVSSIVEQAASILDEEMARGVLAAARRSGGGSLGPAEGATPVLRQMHELVDNIAAMWPSGQSLPPFHVAPAARGRDTEGLADVRPNGAVRAGERATISMALRNSEGRRVTLVPMVTDLLGSRGGRLPSAQLECTPSNLDLAPNEERDITITATVPAGTVAGCYCGLLVVKGVDYLRALITIEVA